MCYLEEIPDNSNAWYVYVLLCNDGSLYKGFTRNLKQRYSQHLAGTGAKHTRLHKPISIVHCEVFETEQDAIKEKNT